MYSFSKLVLTKWGLTTLEMRTFRDTFKIQKLDITKSKLIIIMSFVIMIRFEFASFESKASMNRNIYIRFSCETSYGAYIFQKEFQQISRQKK